MALLDPRLQKIIDIVKPGVPIPSIIDTVDKPGPTRLREFQSLGATPYYASRILNQLHLDAPGVNYAAIARSGAARHVWYDEPYYAFSEEFQTQAERAAGAKLDIAVVVPQARKASSLRSTREEIEARLEERSLARKRDPEPEPPKGQVRAFLGGQTKVNINEQAVMGLDDVRAFTRSKDLHDQGATGKGVKVAVLDTGADPGHPMLDGRISKHLSFVPEDAGFDGQGHGSWTTATVGGKAVEYQGKIDGMRGRVLQGMADECDLLSIKVLTSEGTGAVSATIAGMEAAYHEGARVLSMSLGGLFGGVGLSPDAQMVDELTKRGVNCVIASGNSFAHFTVGSPASARGSITVGSIAMRNPYPGAASTFSSKGPTLDGRLEPTIAAPGGNIGKGADEVILGATAGRTAVESGEAFGGLRGTSMATPVVAGLVVQAVPLGFPKDRRRVEEVLAMSGQGGLKRFGGGQLTVKNNRTGWGPIDAVALREALDRKAPPAVRAASAGVYARGRPLLGGIARAALGWRKPPGLDPEQVRLVLI